MQKAVCLASGGLDSSTCLYLLKGQEGIEPIPVFIDYGQLNRDRELAALGRVCEDLKIAQPVLFDIASYSKNIKSGLTDRSLDVVSDAFTPCRNLIFLTFAAAYAFSISCNRIFIGLLSQETMLFPDQSDIFIERAQSSISTALGASIEIVTPLRDLHKNEVVTMSRQLGVKTYYSCHAGTPEPCGRCIACKEYEGVR